MPCTSDPPRDVRPLSFWRDTRTLRFYLIGSLCLAVWYRAYVIVAPVVASWWHARSALQTISSRWK
jgi:hypothetical protein